MSPYEFLEAKLSDLSNLFPFIHIKYGYDEMINSYIVELNPQTEYYTNTDLDNAWIPISIEFMTLFESEDIAFISSDSTLAVGKAVKEFKPRIHVTNDIQLINDLFAPLTNANMDFDLPNNIISPVEIEPVFELNNSNCKVIYRPIIKKQPKEKDNDYLYSLAA